MPKQTEVIDGRRLRSERSKKAILEACGALMKEGQLVPTAQMISDKAGVPIRSFFRHFPDMQTLFRELDASLQPSYERSFAEVVCNGSLSERIDSAVRLHAKTWEEHKPIIRSTKAQLWRYTVLQENYARWQRRIRKDLDVRIPELTQIDSDTRELIDSFTSFEMWARLRDHQKISHKKSTKLIRDLVEKTIRDALAV
ncbi:MAG: AcrR family transcriptional regulator [Cryomorphaceae bacterium]|jgi:AcrR family transcriptional regulator